MKRKGRGGHVVPLSLQAVEVIRAAQTFFGNHPYVFPHTSKPNRCISMHTLPFLLVRAGYGPKDDDAPDHEKERHHCPHGWRSSFSTIMNATNVGPLNADKKDVIEAALAHFNKDRVAGIYNRGDHLDDRRIVMQRWADILMKSAGPAMSLLNKPKRSDLVELENEENIAA
jgi:integrase